MTFLPLVGKWFVLKKAGIAGWKGIIPFYNLFVFARVSKRSNVIPTLITIYSFVVAGFLSYVSFTVLTTGLLSSFFEKIINLFPQSFTEAIMVSGVVGFFIVIIILGLLLLVLLLPSLILQFILFRAVALSFGKRSGFALGLLLLPYVFWLILGFDSSKYLYKDGDVLSSGDTLTTPPPNTAEAQTSQQTPSSPGQIL